MLMDAGVKLAALVTAIVLVPVIVTLLM